MKRNIFIFGAILGIILCVNLVFVVRMIYTNPGFKGNDVVGYAAMVVVFSLTFFGIRNYRNKQLNGYISFGRAFKTGALIALLGATMYVVFWMFYYYLVVPDFLDKYISHALDACRKDPEKLAATTKEMDNFREMYKNPLFVILITYFEVLPVGLAVALVSALILKRKNKNIDNRSENAV
jgi:amino acid transporter